MKNSDMVKCNKKHERIHRTINRENAVDIRSETINGFLSSKHYCVKNENKVTFKMNF